MLQSAKITVLCKQVILYKNTLMIYKIDVQNYTKAKIETDHKSKWWVVSLNSHKTCWQIKLSLNNVTVFQHLKYCF